MNIDFLKEAESLKPALDQIRRELHQHPEIGRTEVWTTNFLEDRLKALGLETYRIAETGVVGILRGTAPSTETSHVVGLRADIDALPVTEQTGCPFSSLTDGIMHACGHDVHMTSAMGAAMILSAHKEEFSGEIRFFFQPDEEGYGGAKEMVDKGCADGVEAVFGAHVDPALPVGSIGVRYGKFYAASDMFDVDVTGVSAHGAQPEKGKNALVTAAEIAVKLTALTNYDPEHKRIFTVGDLTSGTVRNVIADKAHMEGIIRTLGKEERARAHEELNRILEETARKYGTQVMLTLRTSYSGITNTDPETAHVESSLKKTLGDEHVSLIREPLMISEDFGEFVDACSGSFYHLGAGCPKPLHSPDFLPDEMAYVYGAAAHAIVLYGYLNK